MTHDPWAIPAAFYSIIIKTSAIDRSFAGGREQFFRRYQPAFRNGALVSLLAMSISDTEARLAELNTLGLVPGEDVAVADMAQGPLLECPGIAFQRLEESFPGKWVVNVADVHSELERQSEALASTVDQALNSAPGVPTGWIALDTQEAYGAVDSWDEYLCALPTDRGFVLNVLRHQWLGEVPQDWFDDDGQPVPEHRDAEGELKLPDEVDGCTVVGFMYGGFVGGLEPAGPDEVVLNVLTEASVAAALRQLRWDTSVILKVQGCLRQVLLGAPR